MRFKSPPEPILETMEQTRDPKKEKTVYKSRHWTYYSKTSDTILQKKDTGYKIPPKKGMATSPLHPISPTPPPSSPVSIVPQADPLDITPQDSPHTKPERGDGDDTPGQPPPWDYHNIDPLQIQTQIYTLLNLPLLITPQTRS